MADFHQSGVITTLHRLGSPDLERLERELLGFADTRPIALVLPCLFSDIHGEGRKGIVDSSGGRGRHGGGAFSGKDPSKVDRSAAYMARYIAKNIVAAGLAQICEVQLSYAIGVAEPTSVHIDCSGTARIDEAKLDELVREHFALTPRGIIETLQLRRPIYRTTAAHGHFGREPGEGGPGTFTWEATDKAAALKAAARSLVGATA